MKSWKPFKHKNHNFSISHLLFANDVLLFVKVDNNSIYTIKTALEHFCKVSGMKINLEKSKLWLSPPIPPPRKETIANLLQIPKHLKFKNIFRISTKSKILYFRFYKYCD